MYRPANYKYCIVPECKSTTIKTPDKAFLVLPVGKKLRRKWCVAMKRDEKKNLPLSATSVRHVCEDHFDLENDLQNYMRYKLQGGKKFLKKNVIPHIFECQQKSSPTPTRQTGQKRRRAELIRDLMAPSTSSPQASLQSEDTEVMQEESPTQASTPSRMVDKGTQVTLEDLLPVVTMSDKGVQVKPYVRSKEQNTVRVKTNTQETSTELVTTESKETSTIEDTPLPSEPVTIKMFEQEDLSDTDSVEQESLDEYDGESSVSEEEISDREQYEEFQLSIRANFIYMIKKHPLLCIGVPQNCYFLISFLAEKTSCSELNIMITLKKIRLNDSYAILSLHFGMSVSNISRIVRETTVRLASVFKDFIVWPEDREIQNNLPIAFRARYFKVVSIIDCFETEIQKPTNSKNQALTWSEYKKCNTVKYLISCTPDGLINFISDGYGGRATDTLIVKDCGYMDKLSPGNQVMADRGFKFIDTSLTLKGCELVRPPSVATNVQSTRTEVILSKQIASLRIHVERVIRRVREFNLIAPHACVDNQLIQNYDNFVIIACGLTNLQNNLIK